MIDSRPRAKSVNGCAILPYHLLNRPNRENEGDNEGKRDMLLFDWSIWH